jgi:ADP-ribosylglycohydrolase
MLVIYVGDSRDVIKRIRKDHCGNGTNVEASALRERVAENKGFQIKKTNRGYAGGAMRLLNQVANRVDWREISPRLFGSGSFGNGAAMRVAPVGGYFYNDLKRAGQEAQRSAIITHAHIEGQAGAIAVAVAAAIAANQPHPTGQDFLGEVLS